MIGPHRSVSTMSTVNSFDATSDRPTASGLLGGMVRKLDKAAIRAHLIVIVAIVFAPRHVNGWFAG